MSDLDAQRLKPGAVADPGQLQQLRRAHRPGREHDLAAGAGLERLAALLPDDADGASVLDDHAGDVDAGLELEVRPLQHRLEKAPRGAPPTPGALVDLEVAGAEIVAAVEVGHGRDALLRRRLGEGVENLPAHARMLDPPFAAGAVVLAGRRDVV